MVEDYFFKDFPQNWKTGLLAYTFERLHLTVIFCVFTPENYALYMKVLNRLHQDLPKFIKVELTDKIFRSPYNDKQGKVAVDVKILDNDFTKFIPILERLNHAFFRPHISVEPSYLESREEFLVMKLSLKFSTMHKSKFIGFPQYKYDYIFGIKQDNSL